MQYSFIAVIEAWLSGVLFLINIMLFLFGADWYVYNYLIDQDLLKELIPFFAILFCSLAYSVGWIINYIAERIFDPFFQHKFREKLEKEKGISFYDVRAFVFQNGSDHALNDIKYDRQVIRIARSNCFNFFVMFIVLLPYIFTNKLPLGITLTFLLLSLFASCGAFFQWKYRYEVTYKKFYQAYSSICNNPIE